MMPGASTDLKPANSNLVLIASMLIALAGGFVGAVDRPMVLTQQPLDGSTDAGACPPGSRIIRVAPTGEIALLTEDLETACQAAVSFDGTRILFSARARPGEPFNIFEMDVDGSHRRKITENLADCFEPLYLPRASVTPPTFDEMVGWIAFTSTANGFVEPGKGRASSLYVASLEPVQGRGQVVWQTSYNPGSDFSPTALQDGRVVFASRQGEGVKLLSVTWAGDNLNIFRDVVEGAVQMMVCELPERRSVVLVEAEDGAHAGRLVEVALRRPLSTSEVLAEGLYRDPCPTPDGLLVAMPQGRSYGISSFDLEARAPGATVFDDPEWDDLEPVLLAPHPAPIARIPMLEFASVLDITGFDDAGQLHCMNVYDSDQEEILRLPPGSVKWARFFQAVGVGKADRADTEGQADWPPPWVETSHMGDAPVEADGSFFVNIAGNVPFFIELLDESKQVLHRMNDWIWIRSKGQRGCIGCHENKELTPENKATDALLRMQPTTIAAHPVEKSGTSERSAATELGGHKEEGP